jgi:Uma2 family endonuclease
MGFAVTSNLPPEQAELDDLYEIVDGKKVWPRVGEPDTDALYEIVNGERKEIPRMGVLGATIASFLVTHLNIYGWSQKLGFAVAEAMFQLAPDRAQRRPDIAFIAYAGLQPSRRDDPPAWAVVPLLAAEVLSPTNTAESIEEKLQDYFAAGVRTVWVVHPVLGQVYVYESLTQVRILTEKDELDGGAALPGFRVAIQALFAALGQNDVRAPSHELRRHPDGESGPH